MAQLSSIYSTDENEEGSILLLKNKNCDKGFIRVKGKVPLLIEDEAREYQAQKTKVSTGKRALGIVFKYKDQDNFYLLEIFNDNLIRIRKKTLGSYSLIAQNPLVGFEFGVWFKIMLFIKNNHFSVRFFKDSNKPDYNEVFPEDLIDDDLKFGRIGLYSFKTQVYFSDFETYKFNPNNAKDIKNVEIKPLFIDENEDINVKKEAERLNSITSEVMDRHMGIVKPGGRSKNDALVMMANAAGKKISGETLKPGDNINENISKYNFIISQMNKNVERYTWKNCLMHQTPEKKLSSCKILFSSEKDVKNCEKNFCGTCCDKLVGTFYIKNNHRYLCKRQCYILSYPSNKIKIWNKCLVPDQFSSSFYDYCNRAFESDIEGNSRCKVDMCRLCCVNVDIVNPIGKNIPLMSMGLLKRCNDECAKCKKFLFIKLFF